MTRVFPYQALPYALTRVFHTSCIHLPRKWGYFEDLGSMPRTQEKVFVRQPAPHRAIICKQGLHTLSAFWPRSSVVSVLISVTTDMSPTGDLLDPFIFLGEVLS